MTDEISNAVSAIEQDSFGASDKAEAPPEGFDAFGERESAKFDTSDHALARLADEQARAAEPPPANEPATEAEPGVAPEDLGAFLRGDIDADGHPIGGDEFYDPAGEYDPADIAAEVDWLQQQGYSDEEIDRALEQAGIQRVEGYEPEPTPEEDAEEVVSVNEQLEAAYEELTEKYPALLYEHIVERLQPHLEMLAEAHPEGWGYALHPEVVEAVFRRADADGELTREAEDTAFRDEILNAEPGNAFA